MEFPFHLFKIFKFFLLLWNTLESASINIRFVDRFLSVDVEGQRYPDREHYPRSSGGYRSTDNGVLERVIPPDNCYGRFQMAWITCVGIPYQYFHDQGLMQNMLLRSSKFS